MNTHRIYTADSLFSSMMVAVISMILLCGCADYAEPDNFDPVMDLAPATGISRTDAFISAKVTCRGSSLSYLSLRYGKNGVFDNKVDAVDPEEGLFAWHITGLQPGTTYSYYLEGGTSTATLKSPVLEFTTVPNALPALSPPVALSTGPVGIILTFDITDDGGEPVLEAGCEIRIKDTDIKSRVYLAHDCLAEGKKTVRISGLTIDKNYVITPFASNSIGETCGQELEFTTAKEILLTEAGGLATLIGSVADFPLDHLTVAGYMNGDDFKVLRLLLEAPDPDNGSPSVCRLESVDLSDVDIVEGGAAYDGSRFTVADELSTGLFAGCTRLRSIILPVSATRLAADAFACCSSLESLTISAGICDVKPSVECPSLRSIEVSPANPTYSSEGGVLFNYDGSELLWYPEGKPDDEYIVPASVGAIGEYAFCKAHFSHIVFPDGLNVVSRNAFVSSSLVEISLPDRITNISEGMFQNCSSLRTVRFGSGTEYIGDYIFDGTQVYDIYIAATIPPYVKERAFDNKLHSLTESATLHVPTGCMAIYRNHPKWGKFSSIVEY